MKTETEKRSDKSIGMLSKSGSLAAHSADFLNYLENWIKRLAVVQAEEIFSAPERCAILSVDVTNGFCVSGPLASPRVGLIVQPIVRLFERGWAAGLRHILLLQDTHEPDAVEFAQWPAHCVRGTSEAEPVNELKDLPFYTDLIQMPKNSIHAGLNTGLNLWISENPEVNCFIVVGDCTDLCSYQLAMHLRLDANARQLKRRVVLPVDCVDTYDRSIQSAQEEGGYPHPADLLHAVFLYHMALNGVELAAQIR
jgi:nicotinamidase-related amidase